MTAPRDDDVLIVDMVSAAERIIAYVGGIVKNEFYSNKQLQDAVLYQLSVLEEAAKPLSECAIVS